MLANPIWTLAKITTNLTLANPIWTLVKITTNLTLANSFWSSAKKDQTLSESSLRINKNYLALSEHLLRIN